MTKKNTHIPHDVRTLAQTRACNRAISNLAGGGEVSFEEMSSGSGNGVEPSPRPAPKNSPKSEETGVLSEVILKKGLTWNKVFKKYGPKIQTRQEELGPLFTYEQAAVVFVREKGLIQELVP